MLFRTLSVAPAATTSRKMKKLLATIVNVIPIRFQRSKIGGEPLCKEVPLQTPFQKLLSFAGIP
jgi:hypothetical protein